MPRFDECRWRTNDPVDDPEAVDLLPQGPAGPEEEEVVTVTTEAVRETISPGIPAPPRRIGIEFDEVSKVFEGGGFAIENLNLKIEEAEFMVLVGPSGSGKSTALRMVAGLEEATSGEIRLMGKRVNEVDAKDRDIAMIFQSYALYPHMTVAQNLTFALKLRRMPKSDRAQKAREVASMLGISELLERKPAQLSGGQRQRVAMGRAIVREPQAFLMDEPLSNLDAKLRVQMRIEIIELHQRLGRTTIYVTHDQTEAMTMGDRVAVLRDGHLEQVATPKVLYERPSNVFVAGFIGSPAMNLMRGRLQRDSDGVLVAIGPVQLHVPETRVPPGDLPREVIVGIRPEDFEDGSFVTGNGHGIFAARVIRSEPLGSEVIAHLEAGAISVLDNGSSDLLRGLDDSEAEARRLPTLTARLNPRTGVRSGELVQFMVDTHRLYFFDPQTGASLNG
jgi:multiple sugar transport system ATP-binding protein